MRPSEKDEELKKWTSGFECETEFSSPSFCFDWLLGEIQCQVLMSMYWIDVGFGFFTF